MIAIIDYGVGESVFLQSSLKFIGADAEVTNDIAKIKAADRIILPGVGAFPDAIAKLREKRHGAGCSGGSGKRQALAWHLLRDADASGKKLRIWRACRLRLDWRQCETHCAHDWEGLKVPHIGWNRLIFPKDRENPSCSNTSTRATVSISYIPTQEWIVMPLFLRERNTAQS